MEQYHAFVVPSSFDSDLSINYSLSIPTKLPELLGSGRPTLIYGPPNMEANGFCRKLNTGIVIEKEGIKSLKKELSYLLENYNFEVIKAQSDLTRSTSHLFGNEVKNKFKKFILN